MNSPPHKHPRMEPPWLSAPAIQGVSPNMTFSSSEYFKDIRYTDHFVDKTLLLKSLFETEHGLNFPVVLITAPRKFGKSVNMSMADCFLQKQVDMLTGAEIPADHKDSNFKLFEGLKIMEPEHEQFRNQHFGQYAVLRVSFLCVEPVSSERAALDFCKKVIHNAFKEHRYLRRSAQLDDDQQAVCKNWCHDEDYLKKPDAVVGDGLKTLSEYLWLHYRQELKVFVLIDEYDSMYMRVMSSVKDSKELQNIIDHSITLIANLVKGNRYVAGLFLTGISHIGGIELSCALGRVSSYRFLNNHRFVEFYGFTKDEVQVLFEKFGAAEPKRNLAVIKYNGYQSKDGQIFIYNTWSVVHFLKTGIVGNYWINSGAVQGLHFAFKIVEIEEQLKMAFLNSQNESQVAILDKLEIKEFYTLHSMIHGKRDIVATPEMFFTFLLEQGYLSYSGNNGFVKIPNDEIKHELHVKLTQHVQHLYGIKDSDQTKCKVSFEKVFSSITAAKAELHNVLVDLKEKLETLVVPLKKSNVYVRNGNILQQVVFGPLFATGYSYATEIESQEKKKPHFLMYKDGVGIIIELKYMPGGNQRNSADAGLKQILEKRYYSVLCNEEYFVKPATSYLLIGLSFNVHLQVSMCSLQSNVAKPLADLCENGKVLRIIEIEALLGLADVIS